MSQSIPPDLIKFLKPYDRNIQELALWVRKYIRSLYPAVNETIWDAASAVSMGFSFTSKWNEGFCHIAVYTSHVNLGFNQGARLKDPKKMLNGTGTHIRHIRITNRKSFPEEYVSELLQQAVLLVKPASDSCNLITIRVMNSEKKRRPTGRKPVKRK